MCGTVGYMILMTDNEKGYLILQVFITIIILSFTIPLTYHYGVVGLGISYALGFSINNLIELGFLYNREKLIAVTRNDLYMTLLSIPLTIISVLFNQFMTLLISAILTFIIVIIFYLTVYKKLLNEKEQNAIKYIYNRIKL